MVRTGNEIINHLRQQEAVERRDAKGNKRLGGTVSVLHRPSPYKQGWPQMRDGDRWEVFADLVEQRGPHTVSITKVKGHATNEMVEQGKVEGGDKQGNDAADVAADCGAIDSQAKVHCFRGLYCNKHKRYSPFMCRVQRFVAGLKKEGTRLKQEAEKEKDPSQKGEHRKTKVSMHLKDPLIQEEAGEDVTLNRMRGKGKAERLWEQTRDIKEAVEFEDEGDGTLLGGRKTPEIPVHVQQPPSHVF